MTNATAPRVTIRRKNEDGEYPVEVDGTLVGFAYRLEHKYGATSWVAINLDGHRITRYVEYPSRRIAVEALVATI